MVHKLHFGHGVWHSGRRTLSGAVSDHRKDCSGMAFCNSGSGRGNLELGEFAVKSDAKEATFVKYHARSRVFSI